MSVNNNIYLGIGNVSKSQNLGLYYQDFTPAIYHFENNSLGGFDDKGIPYIIDNGISFYSVIAIIQYGIIQHDLYLKDKDESRKEILLNCLNWLDSKSETFNDSLIWRSEKNTQYNLDKGWTSAMYQGQAISLYLRAFQLFDEPKYLHISEKAFNYFKFDFLEGGAKRVDRNGYIWLEEYPTNPPSFVLNGFVYAVLGVLDLFRVTGNTDAKKLYDSCIETLIKNIYKYDIWYWTRYDQLKKELVSYYYQKNVHIPLVKILYLLTSEPCFDHLDKKWSKQLNNKFGYLLVQLMYRIQPRIKKLKS